MHHTATVPSTHGEYVLSVIRTTPKDLSPNAKVILWAMATKVHPDPGLRTSFPADSSAKDIMEATGLAMPTVYKHLRTLIDRGLVDSFGAYAVVSYDLSPENLAEVV